VIQEADQEVFWDVEPSGSPQPYNLVRDFAGLREFLAAELENWNPLDAFLAAAGMEQILADHLHRDLCELEKSARHLRALGPRVGGPASVAIHRLGAYLQRLYPTIGERDLAKWQPELSRLVQELADAVAGVPSARPSSWPRTIGAAALGRASSSLRHSVIRLPACFTTFDQQPADIERLADDFSVRWPNRRQPLVVLGVRTSGSYLAPLMAAFLKTQGYTDIDVMTWRAVQEWLPSERHRLAAAKHAGAFALIVDDPPTSGRTLAGAAAALEKVGFSREGVVLTFASFAEPAWERWPELLSPYQKVTLTFDQWEIQKRLSPLAVQRSLAGLLTGHRVDVVSLGRLRTLFVGDIGAVERIPFPANVATRNRSKRGHVRALYRVDLVEQGTGRVFVQEIYGKGVGLGYLGEASAGIAERLRDYLPAVYGSRDGLLFRAWLPETCRLDPARLKNSEQVIAGIASYAAARSQALSVPEELSRRVVIDGATWGETVWQNAAQLVSPAFGRAAPIARALLRRTFLWLLSTSRPCVIDGKTDLRHWFELVDGPTSSLRKVGFDEGAYKAGTIRNYDAAFDVATAAVGEGSQLAASLRAAYAARSGDRLSEERWLIYRLLALEERRDTAARSSEGLVDALGPLTRDMSLLVNRYLGDLYLADVTTERDGPLCAVDIDGVLETPWLGFTSTTPFGALALRALAKHGYRTVLATGRSLAEVRDRCDAYRLAGGVAEYGAVTYNHQTGNVTPLISDADRPELEALRTILGQVDGVYIDQAHEYAIRAYRIESGRRRRLDQDTVDRALARVSPSHLIQPIAGEAQTDFITVRSNKGSGLRALARSLRADVVWPSPGIAMAVGDTASDLPMLELAARYFAPSNADQAVKRVAAAGKARVTIVDRPYQAGLAKAVSSLLGHAPGSCTDCRRPAFSESAERLIDLLKAQDLGRWGKLGHLLRLAAIERIGRGAFSVPAEP
jgi:hydroxymethylpyrimidine pyrophosphatase-like HAD family hydrolase/adenine/guanine phosphoribosyltransferase-like PRPP-binding protein